MTATIPPGKWLCPDCGRVVTEGERCVKSDLTHGSMPAVNGGTK